jgi:hypothetical protein
VPIPGGKVELIKVPKMDKDGKPIVDASGRAVMEDHYATNAEMLARKWLVSSKHQQDLVDASFGKVPVALDIGISSTMAKALSDEERIRRMEALTRKALGAPPTSDEHIEAESGSTIIDAELRDVSDQLPSTSSGAGDIVLHDKSQDKQ